MLSGAYGLNLQLILNEEMIKFDQSWTAAQNLIMERIINKKSSDFMCILSGAQKLIL